MTVTNAAVGRIFGLIADLLELEGGGDAAKAPTYRRAARSVEAYPDDVAVLHQEDRLRDIPGVGEALARKIGELVDTGRLNYFERLNARIPSGVLDLLRVPGVGIKTAGLVWRELGVASVDKLEAACRSGLLRELPGLGSKKEEAILEGIASYRREAARHPLGLARAVGEALVHDLAALPEVVHASLAGSARRWRDTVGNLDLVVATGDPEAVADAFVRLPEVREVGVREVGEGLDGPTGQVSATLHYGLVVDLRLVPPERFAAALAYFTGSAGHNVRLAERAAKLGLVLDERGLARGRDVYLPATAEEDIYRSLGLAFIPPELREDQGEVEEAAAAAVRAARGAGAAAGGGTDGQTDRETGGKIDGRTGWPRLVELKDIRGDLHVHSTWSDGLASLEDLAAAGERLGYEYVAVSDHTKSLAVARGLDEKRILEQLETIADLNARRSAGTCRLLSGVEVDILADGSLDLPDSALADLDIVTASIHSKLRQPGPQISARLAAAVKNEHVDVLGHPSGRLLGSREASGLDLEAVLDVAAKTGTLLEINASPDRLDLRDEDARRAREAGCRLTVSTDAHSVRGLGDMAYGVAVARRARLRPADVANTRPLAELRKLLA